jgi:hypothetical protein
MKKSITSPLIVREDSLLAKAEIDDHSFTHTAVIVVGLTKILPIQFGIAANLI